MWGIHLRRATRKEEAELDREAIIRLSLDVVGFEPTIDAHGNYRVGGARFDARLWAGRWSLVINGQEFDLHTFSEDQIATRIESAIIRSSTREQLDALKAEAVA